MLTVLALSLALTTPHDTDPQLTKPTPTSRASLGWLCASLSIASATASVAVGAGLLAPKLDAYNNESARLQAKGITNDPALQASADELRDLRIGTALSAVAAGIFAFAAISLLVIWPDRPASQPVAFAPVLAPNAHGATAGVVGFF